MTDEEYTLWLDDHAAERVVLCELEHARGTEYAASQPYVSRLNDSDPSRVYDDLLKAAVDIETRIDSLLSFGDVELVDDGEISHWLDRSWSGHEIRLYLGDPDWSRDDFRLHARGINGGISSATRGEIIFAMLDQSSKLDEVIDTGRVADDGSGIPVPLVLGRLFNTPPVKVSNQTLQYKASYLPAIYMAPKDNGASIPTADALGSGTFTLDNATSGQVTVSVRTAQQTPEEIVRWVAGRYGIAVAEIALPAYKMGLFYSDHVSGRRVLGDLLGGIGAYWYLNAKGELVARQHTQPTSADVTIYPDDIVYGQISLTETQQPWAKLNLKWHHNHAPIKNVAASVSPPPGDRYSEAWNIYEASQSLPDTPDAEEVTREAYIDDGGVAAGNNAETEALRMMALRSKRRDVWSLDVFQREIELGQAVAVNHPRLAGRVGRVISVSKSPTRGITTLELWV